MKKNIYTIHNPKDQKVKVEFFGHYIYENGGSRTIVPIKFKKQNINPKNFLSLKKKSNQSRRSFSKNSRTW